MNKRFRNTMSLLAMMMMAVSVTHAQVEVNPSLNLRTVLNNKMASDYNGVKRELYSDDFSKNPFIFKTWEYSKVLFNDGKEVDSLLLNYDDKEDALLVTVMRGENPFTLNTKAVARFTFYNDPAKPFFGLKKSDFDDSDKAYGFYQRVYGNDDGTGATVLKQVVKKFRDASDQVSYGGSQAESKFDPYTRYYVKTEGNQYKKITLNKKAVQGIIGKANIKGAQALIKSKKLKWGDEEALFLILDKYIQ